MSEAEAKRAAATFEFPGWRAEARQARHWRTQQLVWVLAIYDSSGEARLLGSPEEWLAVYAEMQAEEAGR